MAAALIRSLALSLGLTLGLELAFALLWGLRGRDLVLVLLMNLLTNPPAVTAYFFLCVAGTAPRLPVALAIEGLVVLAEGLCCRYRGEEISRPWAFALWINLFSYGTGAVLQLLW